MFRVVVCFLLLNAMTWAAEFSDVTNLDAKALEQVITDRLGWIVYFGEEGQGEEGLGDLAKKLEGYGRVGFIDIEKEKKLVELLDAKKLGSFYRLYPFGDKELDYSGIDFTTVDEAEAALHEANPDLAVPLVGGEAEKLSEFMSRALGAQQLPLILFVESVEAEASSIPPLAQKIALWWDTSFLIGVIANPPAEVKEQFQVEQLPHIALMVPQYDKDKKVKNMGLISYDRKQAGGIKFKNVMRYLISVKQQLKEHFPAKDAKKKQKTKKDKAQPLNEKVPVVPMFEVTPHTPTACDDNKLGMCIILFTDGATSALAQRQPQIALLEKIQNLPSNKGRPLHFMWVDAKCRPEFGQPFDVSPDMIPAVIAVSPKKLRFAKHIGSFSESAIADFIAGVLGGQRKIVPFQKLPIIPADAPPCAETAAQAPSEEEFDLNSIMGSDDDDEKEEKEEVKPARKEPSVDADDAAEMAAKRRRAEEEIARLNKKSAKSSPKKPAPAKKDTTVKKPAEPANAKNERNPEAVKQEKETSKSKSKAKSKKDEL